MHCRPSKRPGRTALIRNPTEHDEAGAAAEIKWAAGRSKGIREFRCDDKDREMVQIKRSTTTPRVPNHRAL